MKTLKLFLFAVLFTICAAKIRSVSLKHGKLIGFHERTKIVDITVFLGIPYAQPPVGELRFRKPKPITESWNELTANKWPNACLQDNKLPLLSEKSEDCLYLNVWTPVNLDTDFSHNLRPVFVWFHGGGYLNGSSAYPLFDGSQLSSISDIVVVTVNYRLGVFGFLYGNSEQIPGNMGLYDQAMALEWIKDSIAYFGGDNNSVTIAGESVGGKAVTQHLSSPISAYLFKNAIVMSGAGMTHLSVQPPSVAFRNAKVFSKLLNCTEDETSQSESLSESTVDCLRKVSAKQLLATQFNPEVNLHGKNPFRTAFFPVYGEAFIPKAPEELWNEGVFNRRGSLLIGTVPNEGMVTTRNSILRDGKTKKEIINILVEFLETLVPSELSINTEDVIKLYFSSIDDEDWFKAKIAFLTALSDAFYICPSIIFAEKYSNVAPVYQYDFAYYKNNHSLIPCRTFGPCHANDLPFIFGTIESENDREAAVEWMSILGEFVRSGKTHWSPYYRTNSSVLVPVYYTFRENGVLSEQRFAYKQFECTFWKSMIYKNYI